MTTKGAFEYAIRRSDEFRNHVCAVAKAVSENRQSSCLAYAVNGEAFYYGFDGCDLQSGKYSKKRADYLIKRGDVLVINA